MIRLAQLSGSKYLTSYSIASIVEALAGIALILVGSHGRRIIGDQLRKQKITFFHKYWKIADEKYPNCVMSLAFLSVFQIHEAMVWRQTSCWILH